MDLGLAGTTMCAIGFGDAVCLYFSDGHVLSLDAPFAIGTADDTVDLADAEEAAVFFAFVDVAIGAAVTAASADVGGTLRLRFSGGCVLKAEPDPKEEAWHLAGPNGVEVACRPSGRLDVTSPGPNDGT